MIRPTGAGSGRRGDGELVTDFRAEQSAFRHAAMTIQFRSHFVADAEDSFVGLWRRIMTAKRQRACDMWDYVHTLLDCSVYRPACLPACLSYADYYPRIQHSRSRDSVFTALCLFFFG